MQFNNQEILSSLAMLEHVNMGFVAGYLDEGLDLRFINHQALAYLGYSHQELDALLDENILNLFFTEDQPGVLEGIGNLRKLGQADGPYNNQMRLRHKSGKAVWLSGSISRTTEEDGQQLYICAFHDCTRERLMQDELYISNERFRIAIAQTEHICFDYDPLTWEFTLLYGPYERYGLPSRMQGTVQQITTAIPILAEHRQDAVALLEDAVADRAFGSCELRVRLQSGSVVWNRITLSRVSLNQFNHFKIMGIVLDITTEKEVAQKFAQEEQYRNTMLAQAMVVYEANLTKDEVISGFMVETRTRSYSHVLHLMARKSIHPDDRAAFLKHYNCVSLLSSYSQGITEARLDYRILSSESEEYIWVSSRVHLLLHPQSREVRLFGYIRNINSWKLREEELQYQAERDMMTGLYNKTTTERLASWLLDNKPAHMLSALMIIDLDNFKQVNDELGHIMGDAILCEVARCLIPLFSENDIVGRVGGDIFAVFIRDAHSLAFCEEKVKELCSIFRAGANTSRMFTQSASVGISLTPASRCAYTELYEQANSALYAAKAKGKDQYFIYHPGIDRRLSGKLPDSTGNRFYSPKNFHSNVSDYLFRILHTSPNLDAAVNAILQLLCVHFDVSRGYIFEFSQDEQHVSNTYEWCDDNCISQKANLQNLSIADLGDYDRHFEKDDLYILPNLEAAIPEEQAVLAPQGICSMVQCAIRVNGKLHGFLGFDECTRNRIPLLEELNIIQTSADILGGFLVSKRNQDKVAQSLLTLKTIIDNLDNYTYVIEPDTYRLLYFNRKTLDLVPDIQEGDLCHRIFRGHQQPCPDCPLSLLALDGRKPVYKELHNATYDLWIQASASWIDWIDGRHAGLLNCVDITESRRNTLRTMGKS